MSNNDVAISVTGLGKQYYIADVKEAAARRFSLKHTLSMPLRRTMKLLHGQATGAADLDKTIWALRDVSFDVSCGQILGVIGANGAGKSTLLQILGRVTEPTEGRAVVNGRVGSLLQVGTGFHEELTGRENVYLNGSILGISQSTVRRNFDEIVAFSEIGEFIDTPVKHYSSGMHLRLAFAVATQLKPEILLIDEVLSVGDARFRQKSLAKMREIIQQGRTILFVSHNMGLVRQLCSQTILLQDGRLVCKDDTMVVIERYLSDKAKQGGERRWEWTAIERAGVEPFVPLALRIRDSQNRVTNQVDYREPFTIELEYELTRDIVNLRISFSFANGAGESFGSIADFENGANREAGHYVSRCEIPGKFFDGGSIILGLISGQRRIRRLYRDYELLMFNVVAPEKDVLNRRAILRPAFNWETCVVERG